MVEEMEDKDLVQQRHETDGPRCDHPVAELVEELRYLAQCDDENGFNGRADLGRKAADRIEALESALADFLKCARCDPRMDGKQVFSYMDASAFGRAWTKHLDILKSSAPTSGERNASPQEQTLLNQE